MLTASNPAAPAGMVVLWGNSMGPVNGTAIAGQPAPGLNGTNPLTLTTTPTVTVNGTPAKVLFAGLTPGLSGLYQINVQMPFVPLTGEGSLQVQLGTASSQTTVTIPYQQLGFYYVVPGGIPVPGQSISGGSSASFRQTDQLTWGSGAYNAWAAYSTLTSLPPAFSSVPGLALTLKNGQAIVYDNNGIESNATGTFYNNTGGGSDALFAGAIEFYSMSNYFPAVSAGYFHLNNTTTVTEIDGYFDVLGNLNLPFDPSNPYVKYRMNIFSSAAQNLPKDNGTFVGDVFSTDTASGSFSYAPTAVSIISSVATNLPKSIYRLAYKLNSPITLAPGDYWFAHDASVRVAAATSSTASAVPVHLMSQYRQTQPTTDATYRFSIFGQEMFYKPSPWTLNGAIQFRPSRLGENQ